MGFEPQMRPFRVSKLTDLIAEEVLELIQLGFGKQQGIPMTIIEKRDDAYVRIPRREDFQPWTGFCKYLRSTAEGNRLCVEYDRQQAESILSEKSESPKQYICHAGLVDISVPIVIGGEVIAVFFGGQKRSSGSTKEIESAVAALATKVPGLNSQTLLEHANAIEELTEEDLAAVMKKLRTIVGYITTLAKDSYDTKRRLQEELFLEAAVSYFMSQYGKERRQVRQVIQEILVGLGQFAELSACIFLSEQETIPVVTAPYIPLQVPLVRIKSSLNKIIPSSSVRSGHIYNDRIQVHPVIGNSVEERIFLQDLIDVLQRSTISRAYISRFELLNNIPGIFIFIENCGQENIGVDQQSLKERVKFLEDFVSRAREQINAYLVDEEGSDLVAGLAHQFRSPMSWILGRCWALKKKRSDAVSQLGYVSQQVADPKIIGPVIKAFESMGPIVADIENYIEILKYKADSLLYLAASERGQAEFDFRLWSVPQILRGRIDLFRPRGEKYGKTFRLQLGRGADTKIFIDRTQMEIVFDNLLDNAVKYSHAHKEILVTAFLDESRNRYIVRVDNFGLAIEREEQELIFKRYYRGRMVKDVKRQIFGSGIGLAVALSIVEAHGGTIRVDSHRGRGDSVRGSVHGEGYRTYFTLEIPIKRSGG